MSFSFYWHDYETWGANPRWDRPSQFAGIRTDAELNPVGKPLVIYCRPSDDILPHPEACLVTGLTPQQVLREDCVVEAEFFATIHAELSRPQTCALGYNTLRFDDEFTRYGFYRNFYEPYGREWQNGNSRWDIIDMVRLTHALRPEGIEWPVREDRVSFRLEDLTKANGIAHEGAHDALADVYATIALAKRIKQHQPKLFDYVFRMRTKQQAASLLDLHKQVPMLHVSSMYPASRGCIAVIVPLVKHPTNPNGIIVYDLSVDPQPLLELDAAEIQQRLFTAASDLPEGVERIPLKTVHINKCPVIIPLSTLTEEAAERWGIDENRCLQHLKLLQASRELPAKIEQAHNKPYETTNQDPDGALYGGFFSNKDRRKIDQVRKEPLDQLHQLQIDFEDSRLPELFFRYKARNHPQTLTGEEREQWQAYRQQRFHSPQQAYGISLESYRATLARMMIDPEMTQQQRKMLSELADWPQVIGL